MKHAKKRAKGTVRGSPLGEGTVTLSTIAREIRVCTQCDLHMTRQKAVPGEGPDQARVMLVGEAPGKEEDIQGRPFVGRSGRVLDEILGHASLSRDNLYITSVVKCRPPQNRTPHKMEYRTCVEAHLVRQIAVITPVIICLLGGVAAEALLEVKKVSRIRGEVVRQGENVFYPTCHPAAAGRSRAWYRTLQGDLLKLRTLLPADKPSP